MNNLEGKNNISMTCDKAGPLTASTKVLPEDYFYTMVRGGGSISSPKGREKGGSIKTFFKYQNDKIIYN